MKRLFAILASLSCASILTLTAATVHPIDNFRKPDGTPLVVPQPRKYETRSGAFALPETLTVEAPEAIVLEYLNQELGRFSRKAVKAAPSLYVAWETLGSILMDQGINLDEAESCIRKACDLSKAKNGQEADVRMLISLARVQVKRGDKQHARVSINKVQKRIEELSAFERREFEEVKKGVR